jgi:hypothetical protein
MSTHKQSTKDSGKKNSRQDKNSSGTMKIFYVFMLALLLFSSIIRITGASRRNKSASTPAPQAGPVSGGGTAALAFVFHREVSGSGACTDLVIPTKGSAVYSNCANGAEKQYDLSDVERSQLGRWRAQFQPVNYEHTDTSKNGDLTTRLYLNGLGNQAASDSDIQAMIDFARELTAKIGSQP